MKAANSPMPRSPEASRAPLVTITAMIESCWPNCMVGPTRAVTRATDTAALRASSTLWPSVDATWRSARNALTVGRDSTAAVICCDIVPMAFCWRSTPLRIDRTHRKMPAPANVKVASTTSSRTQSSTPMAIRVPTARKSEDGIWATPTSTTERSCVLSELARATRLPAPSRRTLRSGKVRMCEMMRNRASETRPSPARASR